MSSADHTVAQTDAMAAAPGRERLPRLRSVLLEQVRTGLDDWKRTLLAYSVAILAYAILTGLLHRGRLPDDGAGVSQMAFFPELGWYVLLCALVGLALGSPPAPNYSTLPVPRAAHARVRVAGVGVLVFAMMAGILVAGALYAQLVGNLTGYLSEVAVYFPVPLVAGIIGYLFAAAVGLAVDVYERWWAWAVGGILLAAVVTFLSERPLPEPADRIVEHVMFVFGGAPPAETGAASGVAAFPYGEWLPLAALWLGIAIAAVVYSASRYEEPS